MHTMCLNCTVKCKGIEVIMTSEHLQIWNIRYVAVCSRMVAVSLLLFNSVVAAIPLLILLFVIEINFDLSLCISLLLPSPTQHLLPLFPSKFNHPLLTTLGKLCQNLVPPLSTLPLIIPHGTERPGITSFRSSKR